MTGLSQAERDLKVATADLVRDLHGYEAAGSYVNRGKSQAHRWASIDDHEDFIPLRFVPELERRAPVPHVTRALARIAGGVFIRLPTVFEDDDTLPLQVCALVDQLGDVSEAVRAGLADGRSCAADAARIEGEAEQLIEKAVALREYARLLQGKGAAR